MTEKRSIQAMLGQFPVTLDLDTNLRAILSLLDSARPHDLVVLPEGALSGYDENPAFLQALSPEQIDAALELLQGLAKERGLHLFLGTCLRRS